MDTSNAFPNESDEYRHARNELLEAEKKLRRQIEEVAALRRRLPLGGTLKEDYAFDEHDGSGTRTTRLSELFGDKKTLVIYSYMFGPSMQQPCPSCTAILDGLDGQAPHIRQNVAFGVVARSPIERVRAFARERGWRNLRLLSSATNTFNRDYHAEESDGRQNPILHAFVRRARDIHHSWSSELLFTKPDPGQDPRHVDLIWPLWHVLDVTPEGRGDFHPRLTY
jgi:predicted dithiol-disulfide oxidoreductase (DUF899 family)